ncbi:MAG TPA: BamA/TamA family outer membrane protein, partial [Pseudolabrys sp.]
DGFLASASVADRNLLGRGEFAKVSVSYGQYSRGAEFNFVEPYLLGYRMAGGFDLFYRSTLASSYVSYDTKTVGVNLRLGFALSEEIAFAPHYSIYQQEVSLPDYLNNCVSPVTTGLFPTTPPAAIYVRPLGYSTHNPGAVATNDECYYDGEASLPVRIELAKGPVVVSLVGYSLSYNTLDNNKSPTTGMFAELKQDLAGVGGDVNFLRTTAETRNYYEVFPDIVSVLHLQGGVLNGWGGQQLRMLDNFQMGPNLVRGFAPSGIGPRDISPYTTQDALGGTMYWGASVEAQTPLYFMPKEIGIKLAVYADAGSLWNYQSETHWDVTGETLAIGDDKTIRSSVGVGLIWDSPLGPLRFDLAYALTKASYDRTQFFRFSGGTKF